MFGHRRHMNILKVLATQKYMLMNVCLLQPVRVFKSSLVSCVHIVCRDLLAVEYYSVCCLDEYNC